MLPRTYRCANGRREFLPGDYVIHGRCNHPVLKVVTGLDGDDYHMTAYHIIEANKILEDRWGVCSWGTVYEPHYHELEKEYTPEKVEAMILLHKLETL